MPPERLQRPLSLARLDFCSLFGIGVGVGAGGVAGVAGVAGVGVVGVGIVGVGIGGIGGVGVGIDVGVVMWSLLLVLVLC